MEFKQGSIVFQIHQDHGTQLMHIQLSAVDSEGKIIAFSYTGFHPQTYEDSYSQQDFLNALIRTPLKRLLDTVKEAGYEIKC